jgi:hypothetical protein
MHNKKPLCSTLHPLPHWDLSEDMLAWQAAKAATVLLPVGCMLQQRQAGRLQWLQTMLLPVRLQWLQTMLLPVRLQWLQTMRMPMRTSRRSPSTHKKKLSTTSELAVG